MYDGYVDFILDLYGRPCQCMGLRDRRLWRDTPHRPEYPPARPDINCLTPKISTRLKVRTHARNGHAYRLYRGGPARL